MTPIELYLAIGAFAFGPLPFFAWRNGRQPLKWAIAGALSMPLLWPFVALGALVHVYHALRDEWSAQPPHQ